MTKKPFSYEEFKQIYSRIPRLCIDPIVRTQGGVVLSLRKEGYGWGDQWHLPGGMLLYKETVEDGLRRVLRDEIGAEVSIDKVLGYMEFHSEEKERGFGYSVSLVIVCDLVSGELRPDENASEVRIFTELPERMVEEHKIFLQEHWQDIF